MTAKERATGTRLICYIGFLLSIARISFSSALSGASRYLRGVELRRMHLRNDPALPYSLTVASITELDSSANFLATQVWPSARAAAQAIQANVSPQWTVCEFGCGPGLPSLVAASLGCKVWSTDVDEFALEMVQAAAVDQGWNIETRKFDLIEDGKKLANMTAGNALKEAGIDWIYEEDIDLVIFSDVFENDAVATGAAQVTRNFLERGTRVWTFAQSDRVQRDAYLKELNRHWTEESLQFEEGNYDATKKLWLCDLDEITIKYV